MDNPINADQQADTISGIFKGYNDVVTVPELAKMLRIGRNTAYELVNSGQIKSVKVKAQIRIPKDSVIAFIKGKSASA